MAWLSGEFRSPSTAFRRSDVPYRLLDGSVVAKNWTELTNDELLHPIDVFENGSPVPPGQTLEVWTGTSSWGFGAGNTCIDWTISSPDIAYGIVGLSDATDARWSLAYDQFCDRDDVHLYCFEQ